MNTKVRLGSCEGDQGLGPNPRMGSNSIPLYEESLYRMYSVNFARAHMGSFRNVSPLECMAQRRALRSCMTKKLTVNNVKKTEKRGELGEISWVLKQVFVMV